jgi:hypothetical protein
MNENQRLGIFARYMSVQMHCIDEAKWFQGEYIKSDPGQQFVLNWIQENSITFRHLWDDSCCKNCYHWKNCGQKVISACDNYLKLE